MGWAHIYNMFRVKEVSHILTFLVKNLSWETKHLNWRTSVPDIQWVTDLNEEDH